MFDSSQDIFYLAASICVGFLTVFLIVFLYNLIKILREVNATIDRVHSKLEKISGLFAFLSNKVVKYGFEKFFSTVKGKNTKK